MERDKDTFLMIIFALLLAVLASNIAMYAQIGDIRNAQLNNIAEACEQLTRGAGE